MDTNRPVTAPASGSPQRANTTQQPVAAPGVSPATAPVGQQSGGGSIAPKLAHPAAATAAPKIQHSRYGFGSAGVEEAAKPATRFPSDARPLPVAESEGPGIVGGKITAFGKERRHEDRWSRTPNTTGHGAIHVKTFHCKLTEDAILYMDQAINEWLDAHPQYEVKFVSSTIGTLTGKLKEPALFCQVWV